MIQISDLDGGLDTAPAAPAFVDGIYSPTSVAMDRQAAVLGVLEIVKTRGVSISEACREMDVRRANFDRWKVRYEASGLEGLEDNYANCGRRPAAVLDDRELQKARALYAKTKSITAALRMLASTTECSDEVATTILKKRRSKHTITPTLRAQVKMPKAVMDWHESPSRVKREAFITPRRLSFLDVAGVENRILPGMLAERDDMSNNFLFWIDWPWGGDPCSEKYGVRIARGQNLMHLDVGSLRFLSFLMLVRLRDSYRADDIWQWVGQTYRDLGIPQIGERWERGIWQANKLRGDAAAGVTAGHTDAETRLGGISALNRKIIVSQSPTTKIIENRFRYFQRICATIPGQIGASRGEMEKVNKLWTECRQGRRDPRHYFLSYEDTVRELEAKIQFMNAEQVEGSIYNGIPNEIWEREGGDERMTRLSAEQSYLFSRDRTVVTVNKGHALVRVTAPDGRRQGWYFHHPDLWRHDGKRVALYLDKYAPEAGATLVHAEGRQLNEVIGPAQFVDGCPQFALGAAGDSNVVGTEALARRQAFTTAVRAEYRALGLTHTITRGHYAADGLGKSTLVEQGSGRATAPTVPATPKPSRSIQPAEAEPDLDEIARLEREAAESGEILLT